MPFDFSLGYGYPAQKGGTNVWGSSAPHSAPTPLPLSGAGLLPWTLGVPPVAPGWFAAPCSPTYQASCARDGLLIAAIHSCAL